MIIKQLNDTPLKTILTCFNKAFSDYSQTIDMDESAFSYFLTNNSVNLNCSIGAFNDDKMIGFILLGQREDKIYDSGTAVIKEERGKGIAKAMLDYAVKLPYSEFILECISDNEKALNLYKSFDFKITEEYICFSFAVTKTASTDYTFENIINLKSREAKLMYKPSWQNSYESVLASGNYKLLTKNDEYIAYNEKGNVASFFAHDISSAKALFNATGLNLRIVNQNLHNPLIQELLKETEVKVIVKQYKMVRQH